MPANTAIPTPPRLSLGRPTGNNAADIAALHSAVQDLHEYLGRLHASAVVESKLLDPSHQATPAAFDENKLPDPGNSSIATATDVANRAYALAKSLVP